MNLKLDDVVNAERWATAMYQPEEGEIRNTCIAFLEGCGVPSQELESVRQVERLSKRVLESLRIPALGLSEALHAQTRQMVASAMAPTRAPLLRLPESAMAPTQAQVSRLLESAMAPTQAQVSRLLESVMAPTRAPLLRLTELAMAPTQAQVSLLAEFRMQASADTFLPASRPMRDRGPRKHHERLLADIGPFCQGCGADYGFDTRVLEVDHINPRSQGGTDAYENLTLLCPPCNKVKRDHYTLIGLQRENRKDGHMKHENNLRMGRARGRTRRRRR